MKETWWSGLTYLFAKEAGPLKGLEGSNPSVSAVSETSATLYTKYFLDRKINHEYKTDKNNILNYNISFIFNDRNIINFFEKR